MNHKSYLWFLCSWLFFWARLSWAYPASATAQELSVLYEELTAPDFVSAVAKAQSVCLLPLGILEKHGAHLPLGTDLFDCRETARRAASQEYVIVFPAYYFGQIFEARHQPGTISYSPRLIFDLLEETCAELARNGLKKIILFNGHGGNEHFLPYFCQAQLASRRDYALYLYTPAEDLGEDAQVKALRQTRDELHGGEMETSIMLAIRPDLVRLERAGNEDGSDLRRLGHLADLYTGTWWLAGFPNHYAGDARPATVHLGEVLLQKKVACLTNFLRQVKADKQVAELQQQFYDLSQEPLRTKQ